MPIIHATIDIAVSCMRTIGASASTANPAASVEQAPKFGTIIASMCFLQATMLSL